MLERFCAPALLALLGASLGACRGEATSTPSAPPTESHASPATPPSPSPAGSPAATSTGSAATDTVPNGAARTWSFDTDKPDAPPTGFSFGRTGSGKPGTWVIKAEPDAPSKPSLLAQVDTDRTDYRFP